MNRSIMPTLSIGYRPYITIMKELSWNERSFLIHSLTAPLKMVALPTSRIYLMIYLIDISNNDKICD